MHILILSLSNPSGISESENFCWCILHSFSVFGDYADSIEAYMKNSANLGLFAEYKIVSNYAERINAYMKKMQKETKLRISW
jgi:maltooligosyltrehalose synthase